MNLLHPLPDDIAEEVFTELLRNDAVRIQGNRAMRGIDKREGSGYGGKN